MIDQRILDAEDSLARYKRYLMEFHTPTLPRNFVEELVEALEDVLNAFAELNAAYEPMEADTNYPPDVEFVDPSLDNDWMEPDETDY